MTGWIPGYEPPQSRGPLTDSEKQEVIQELDRLEEPNNERLSRAQQTLLRESTELGLSELRERLGRSYG